MKLTRSSVATIAIVCILLAGALFAPLGIAGAAPSEQALQAVPSYVNPITRQIEDSGNNPGIGQGMVEELIKKTPALMLKDAEGSVFITFRVGLVAESKDFAIELLDAQGKAKGAVPYSIVAEQPDQNTQDLRIKVPSIDSILRVSLISIPMGREVVGFVTFAPEGEAVTIPTAEGEEVDDSAISIYENAGNDEISGVSDEARGPLLIFLAIAGGLLLVGGGVAGIIYVRKKKANESK